MRLPCISRLQKPRRRASFLNSKATDPFGSVAGFDGSRRFDRVILPGIDQAAASSFAGRSTAWGGRTSPDARSLLGTKPIAR